MHKNLLLLSVLLLLSFSANAEFLSGEQLREHLDEAQAGMSLTKKAIAIGYISAVHDMGLGVQVCPERGVSATELIDVVHRFLRANPGRSGEVGAKLALEALSIRFPCRR
jgi:hypothetical protein